MGSYAAIDFETATGDRESACALGMVIVENGEATAAGSWLIRPPGNTYDPWNCAIHGIYPQDTADAPSFAEVWPQALEAAKGRLLVAHNAGFDIGVARAASAAAGVSAHPYRYACTMVLGRRLWTGRATYALEQLCDDFDIALDAAHDPQADALACANLAALILRELACDTLEEACEKLGVIVGRGGDGQDLRCARGDHHGRRLPDADPNADPSHPFYGARLVFTGTLQCGTRDEAARLAAACGASSMTTVSKKTDYLVIGEQDPRALRGKPLSRKAQKAADLAAAGAEIQILTEYEFVQMLAS
jgi:DNA polymerase-3 subunit epsilon